MISEFSFIVFKINIVTKRIERFNSNGIHLTNLDRCELTSLEDFQKYLIERALNKMVNIPYFELAKLFFRENDLLFKDSIQQDENIKTFTQLSSYAISAIAI